MRAGKPGNPKSSSRASAHGSRKGKGKAAGSAKPSRKAADKAKPKPKPVPEYHSSSEDEELAHDDDKELSSDNGEEVTPTAPVVVETKGAKGKGKGRGTGKKGKVFLEDKAGLLSLITSVTDSKDAVVSSKLERERGRAAAVQAREGEKKKVGKKANERAKALNAAKDAIREREREKRQRKKGKDVDIPEATSRPKRVGFA